MSRFYSTLWRVVRPAQWGIVLLLGVAVLAGCRSSRATYRFQPIGRSGGYGVAAAPVATPQPSKADEQVENKEKVTPHAVVPKRTQRLSRLRVARQIRALASVSSSRHLLARPATASIQHQTKAARPHQRAEVGLGTTVLGVLGLLALPIGLIGLAFGGGIFWLVLAGLGALAVLVAYLDPFK